MDHCRLDQNFLSSIAYSLRTLSLELLTRLSYTVATSENDELFSSIAPSRPVVFRGAPYDWILITHSNSCSFSTSSALAFWLVFLAFLQFSA